MFGFISYMRPLFQDWETWLVYLMHRNEDRGSNKMKKHRNKLQTNKQTKNQNKTLDSYIMGRRSGEILYSRRRIRMQFNKESERWQWSGMATVDTVWCKRYKVELALLSVIDMVKWMRTIKRHLTCTGSVSETSPLKFSHFRKCQCMC